MNWHALNMTNDYVLKMENGDYFNQVYFTWYDFKKIILILGAKVRASEIWF